MIALILSGMLWGERVGRRRAIVGLLAFFAMADAALAFAVLSARATTPAAPLPLHPIAGSFVPDDTQLQECSDERCFQQAFGNIAYYRGPKDALALVDDVYGDGGNQACHRVVHAIGAASLARFDGSVERTFAVGSSICGSGYYHGVLERSLVTVRKRTPEALGRVARTLCTERGSGGVPWIAYQCLHGLGHGLMIATGLTLPVSLDVCRRLATWWDRDACRGGVFMENIQSSYGFQSRWLRADDPVYPCNAVARGDRSRCYQLVTSRILPFVGNDWERTAQICSEVEAGFVDMCFRSFGRDVSSRTLRDPAETTRLCEIARPYGGERECIVAAAMDVAFNFASGTRAAEFCAVVSENLQASCYFGVGAVMGKFRRSDSERLEDCEAVASTPGLVGACVRGGRSTLPLT